MSDEYIPRYLEGHLYVNFKKNCPEGMPRYLEEKFGYEMLESNFDWNIYNTGDDIKKAVENFSKYEEFIEWTEKRDGRQESRYKCQEELENMARNLDADINSNNFKKSLGEIVKYIKNFKD